MRKQRTARRDNRCAWCGRRIPKGEAYIAATVRDMETGGWRDTRRHIHCDALITYGALRAGMNEDSIDADAARAIVTALCAEACGGDWHSKCPGDRFSCGNVIYTLRRLPGYSEVKLSAERAAMDDEFDEVR